MQNGKHYNLLWLVNRTLTLTAKLQICHINFVLCDSKNHTLYDHTLYLSGSSSTHF